jgi:hypothetical protein
MIPHAVRVVGAAMTAVAAVSGAHGQDTRVPRDEHVVGQPVDDLGVESVGARDRNGGGQEAEDPPVELAECALEA